MNWLRRHWPRLHLRTLLFGIFLFVAGLPGLSAIFLRVYENTLVRQTEAELVAQGAALAAAAGGRFAAMPKPGPASPRNSSFSRYDSAPDPGYYKPEPPRIDLNSDDILPERPDPVPGPAPGKSDTEKAAQLSPVLAQTARTTLASIILTDARGTILTGDWTGQSYAHVPEVQHAMAGNAVTLLRRNGDYEARYAFEWLSRAAALRVHHARPILVDGKVTGVLVLSRSSRALFRGMYEDRGKIALGFSGILAILVLLTMLLHRTIARPIEALSRATGSVALGRGDIPEPPATAAIEIQNLYRDFRDMAEVIARRSRYLKDFAAAVSHEFKTPLAGIRGGVELIEDHGASMSEADLKRFLSNITADADRLSALVRRLLDLARADMARPEVSDASDVAALAVRLADGLAAPGFEVESELPSGLPRVAMAPETLETVLTGLIENARQAGASRVTLTASEANETITLTIIDNGPGIAPADAARMFEPFFTTRRSEGGTGLGLAIARSLVEAHLGSIDLLPGTGGTTIAIRLPVASAGMDSASAAV
jgi:signal transduction histidine kinase